MQGRVARGVGKGAEPRTESHALGRHMPCNDVEWEWAVGVSEERRSSGEYGRRGETTMDVPGGGGEEDGY
jgi:hypothetical protein